MKGDEKFLDLTTIKEFSVPQDKFLKVTECGNIIEVMYSEHKSNGNSIRRLTGDTYLDLTTGEVRNYIHTVNRAQSKNELRKTFKRIRDYINCNTVNIEKCKWVTLTYAENMRDTKRLYSDVKKFIMRLRYLFGKFEYIQVIEPQARGAWHIHMIMIFPVKAPFIQNNEMQKIWGYGLTLTKKIDNNNNIGAYLSAHLGDIEFTTENYKEVCKHDPGCLNVKEIEIKGVKKKFIKGGRLHLYPSNMKICRCSRGIKKPKISYQTNDFITKKISGLEPTYEKTLLIDSHNSFKNILNYKYYNLNY